MDIQLSANNQVDSLWEKASVLTQVEATILDAEWNNFHQYIGPLQF